MLGSKESMRRQMAFVQAIDIESMVPENYHLRLIDEAVDFSFVRGKVAHLYSPTKGRPSIDPEVAFRIMTLCYLLDISENRLFTELPLHAGYLWFCGMDFNSSIPDRTTLVKARKQWRKSGVFDEIMKEIVRQCVGAGLVKGEVLATDGTAIQARASIKSLEAINPKPVEKYLTDLRKEDDKVNMSNEAPRDSNNNQGGGNLPALVSNTETSNSDQSSPEPKSQRKSGDPDFRGEKFSNQTHRSTTDPEARLLRKGAGKEAKLSYLGHNLIDVHSGVILNAMATLGNVALERNAALSMLKETTPYLPEPKGERRVLLADGNYTAGDFLAEVIELEYDPLVPMESLQLEPVPSWKRKTFNVEKLRKRKDRIRLVRARNYARMLNQTKQYRDTYRYRIRIEHTFAEAKDHHGMSRAKSYGLMAVDEQVKMTAVVQNMKRLATLVWRRKKRAARAIELRKAAFALIPQRLKQFFGISFSNKPLHWCLV